MLIKLCFLTLLLLFTASCSPLPASPGESKRRTRSFDLNEVANEESETSRRSAFSPYVRSSQDGLSQYQASEEATTSIQSPLHAEKSLHLDSGEVQEADRQAQGISQPHESNDLSVNEARSNQKEKDDHDFIEGHDNATQGNTSIAPQEVSPRSQTVAFWSELADDMDPVEIRTMLDNLRDYRDYLAERRANKAKPSSSS